MESLYHESNQASNQSLINWKASGQDSNPGGPSKTDVQNTENPLMPEQHCSAMELKDNGSATQVVEQHNDASHELAHLPEPQTKSFDGFSQAQLNQRIRVTTSTEQSASSKNQGKLVPFSTLLPALSPHLDKDKNIQLRNLFNQLRVAS